MLLLVFDHRTSYKSRIFLIPVCVFSFVYTLPKFYELRHVWEEPQSQQTQNGTNATFPGNSTSEEGELEMHVRPTWLRKNRHYITIYLIWSNLFIQVRARTEPFQGCGYAFSC